MHDGAQRSCREASGDAAAASANMAVSDDVPHIGELFTVGEFAGGGEEVREAGKYALYEHVSEIPLVLDAELPAQLLHAVVRLKADGEFLS